MIDFDYITESQTYSATFSQADDGIVVTVRAGYLTRHSLPPVSTQERAEAMADAVLSVLNEPTELQARIDAEVARRKASEAEAAKNEQDKLAYVRGVLAKTCKDVELVKGDVVVVRGYDRSDWRNRDGWATLVWGGAVWRLADGATSLYLNSSKTDALSVAKEKHEGRILLVDKDKVTFSRKGKKSSRQYADKFRIYSLDRFSKKFYNTNVTCDTYEEAEAEIAARAEERLDSLIDDARKRLEDHKAAVKAGDDSFRSGYIHADWKLRELKNLIKLAKPGEDRDWKIRNIASVNYEVRDVKVPVKAVTA